MIQDQIQESILRVESAIEVAMKELSILKALHTESILDEIADTDYSSPSFDTETVGTEPKYSSLKSKLLKIRQREGNGAIQGSVKIDKIGDSKEIDSDEEFLNEIHNSPDYKENNSGVFEYRERICTNLEKGMKSIQDSNLAYSTEFYESALDELSVLKFESIGFTTGINKLLNSFSRNDTITGIIFSYLKEVRDFGYTITMREYVARFNVVQELIRLTLNDKDLKTNPNLRDELYKFFTGINENVSDGEDFKLRITSALYRVYREYTIPSYFLAYVDSILDNSSISNVKY